MKVVKTSRKKQFVPAEHLPIWDELERLQKQIERLQRKLRKP
jgi:hypothetical protein